MSQLQARVLFGCIVFAAQFSYSAEREALAELLADRTLGLNPFYSQSVAPARSLGAANRAEGVDPVAANNTEMLNEMELIINAFKNSAEDAKLETVKAAIAQIDESVVSQSGVNISFRGDGPSHGLNRAYMMIPKTAGSSLSASALLDTISSFRRSARPQDHVFSYSNAQSPTTSEISHIQGNDETWKKDQAPAAMTLGEDYLIKKCRRIFGWRCGTSLVKVGEVLEGAENTKYLVAGSFDLGRNEDHEMFRGDGRSRNQVAGSTVLAVIKESEEWILYYSLDVQLSDGAPQYEGMIRDATREDFGRFKRRVAEDLAIGVDEIK